MDDRGLPSWGENARKLFAASGAVWSVGLLTGLLFEQARWIALTGVAGIVCFGLVWLAAEVVTGYRTPR